MVSTKNGRWHVWTKTHGRAPQLPVKGAWAGWQVRRVVDLDDGIAVGVDEREVLLFYPLNGGDPVDSPCQPIYNPVNYMGRRFWR